MANRLLRHIAVKIGAGLATGFILSSANRRPRRPAPNLSPILTRIEDIESRISRVELAPQPAVPSPEEIAALGTLVSSQSEDIASLRQSIEGIESRNAAQAEVFGRKVALVEKQVPAHIEASVNAKMAELEQKLRSEFQEIHYKTVDMFVETIEKRVVGRISAIENSLVEQSQSIVSLREKSCKTDDNLQRLLEAVEKLCARAEAQAQIPVHQPPPPPEARPVAETHLSPEAPRAQGSFESHYRQALARETERTRETQAEAEPGLAFAGAGRNSPVDRRGMKTVGVALAGLLFLGFRLLR